MQRKHRKGYRKQPDIRIQRYMNTKVYKDTEKSGYKDAKVQL